MRGRRLTFGGELRFGIMPIRGSNAKTDQETSYITKTVLCVPLRTLSAWHKRLTSSTVRLQSAIRSCLVGSRNPLESRQVDAMTAPVRCKSCAKAEQIDLVIMDVGLPDIDGREAVRILRKNVSRRRSSCSRATTPIPTPSSASNREPTIMSLSLSALPCCLRGSAPCFAWMRCKTARSTEQRCRRTKRRHPTDPGNRRSRLISSLLNLSACRKCVSMGKLLTGWRHDHRSRVATS